MNKINEKKINDIIHTVGLNNNLTDNQIREIVESQFRLTYKIIKGLNISEFNDEEVDELKTNFYYKYIGKLYTNSEVVKRHKKKDAYFIQLKKQKEEDGRTSEFDMGRSGRDSTSVSDSTNI